MVVVTILAVALLAAGLVVAPWRAWALDRDVARRDGAAPAPDAGVEEIALLAGGPRRVAETAVARLVEAGVLVVEADRSVHHSGPLPQGDLDRAVLDATVVGGLVPTASGLVGRVRHTAAVDAVVAGARRRGLMHDAAVMGRLRRDGLLALGACMLLAIVGAVLLGGQAGLVLATFLLALGLFGVAVVVAVTGARRPTRRGRATLDTATPPMPWGRAPASRAGVARTRVAGAEVGPAVGATVAAGAAGLVAVGGLAHYPDAEIARLLAPPPSAAGGGGGFVGGGDGGGGGCGGGDGGGGGGSC